MTELYETKSNERAILIGVGDDTQRSLKELELLCETAGLEVVEVFEQKTVTDSKLYCGKGKADEILEAVIRHDAHVVIADDELLEVTPSHLRMRKRILQTDLRAKAASRKKFEKNSN